MTTLPDVVGNSGLICDGDWIETKDQDPGGDVRLIQLADIGLGTYLNKSRRFLTSSKAHELKCTFLTPGDLLIARMPDPIGRACVFPGDPMPAVTAVDVCIVRPDPEIASVDWLNWVVNSDLFHRGIERFITGTTRQRISRSNLEQIAIPLPPLREQRRLAAILNKSEQLRSKHRDALVTLDALVASLQFRAVRGNL
jgi:type I restriction enzyme, S subunit